MSNPDTRCKVQAVRKNFLTPYPLPLTSARGFALLISVIFMSVMLAFGVALSALGYKQQVLASSAIESQYAFYAADAALECVLYYDQQENLFAYEKFDNGNTKTMKCDGVDVTITQPVRQLGQPLVSDARVSLDGSTRCADITVYKPPVGSTSDTYLYARGYDVSCGTVANPGNARFVSRGLYVHY